MAKPIPSNQRQDEDRATATRPTPAIVVAVTGIHGALGNRVVENLLRDPRVRQVLCVDVKAPSSASARLSFVDVDLTSLDAERQLGTAFADHRVDCVAHLAFRDGPSPYPGYSHELESIGTMRIVQACLEAKVRKLVMWSRTWVYGATSNAPALLEELQPARATRSERFFADKIDAERDISAFRAPGRGRLATILRMAPLVDPAASNHVVRLLSDERVPSVLGFDPMWQLLHIEDACQALQQAVFRDGPAVINIASTGAVPLSVARRMLGARPLSLPRSLAAAFVGGLWLTGLGHIPPSLIDYLQFSCVADCSLSRTMLGFVPTYSTLTILEQAAKARAIETVTRSPA
jgi:UDP-glucose 4-epimerase